MTKLWGIVLLVVGDILLVRYLGEHAKKKVRCLWEMIGFLSTITDSVTGWKRTLEKAILQEKHPGVFPKIFQNKFLKCRESLPLREALQKSLEELPLSKQACETCVHYFQKLGKSTAKSTEECFCQTKRQLENILKQLQAELPKTTKLISASVYSVSAMTAILLL